MSASWRVVLNGGQVADVPTPRNLLKNRGNSWYVNRDFGVYTQTSRCAVAMWADIAHDGAEQILAPGELTRAEAVEQERAAVVAYLRAKAEMWSAAAEKREEARRTHEGDSLGVAARAYAAEQSDSADEIERGEHVKGGV